MRTITQSKRKPVNMRVVARVVLISFLAFLLIIKLLIISN